MPRPSHIERRGEFGYLLTGNSRIMLYVINFLINCEYSDWRLRDWDWFVFGNPGEKTDNLFTCYISTRFLPACHILVFMNADSCLLDVCAVSWQGYLTGIVCATQVQTPPFWSHEAPARSIDASLLPADAGSQQAGSRTCLPHGGQERGRIFFFFFLNEEM